MGARAAVYDRRDARAIAAVLELLGLVVDVDKVVGDRLVFAPEPLLRGHPVDPLRGEGRPIVRSGVEALGAEDIRMGEPSQELEFVTQCVGGGLAGCAHAFQGHLFAVFDIQRLKNIVGAPVFDDGVWRESAPDVRRETQP